MKTIKLFFSTLLVVIISAIGMASCNDDDEPKDKVIEVTMSVSENTDIMYLLFEWTGFSRREKNGKFFHNILNLKECIKLYFS